MRNYGFFLITFLASIFDKWQNFIAEKKIMSCIDQNGILEFLNETIKKAINCECHDNSKIEELFYKYIDKDEKKFQEFFASLEQVNSMLKEDLDFFMDSDPAIDSEEEVLLTYPGYKAIMYYRIAHELHKLDIYLPARCITEEAHKVTGIDIHPGAKIAHPFFIDHGTGIVIGATSIIGHHVKMYQGVTLGALSLSKGRKMRGIKRHPTIGNNVTIYSNASILGDISIGDNVTIGGNVFLTESIPSNTRVIIGKPELIIEKK